MVDLVGILLLITPGLLLEVYSLLDVQDFTPQVRVVIHITSYFPGGVDNSGMVSVS